jgi:hypothetical protein
MAPALSAEESQRSTERVDLEWLRVASEECSQPVILTVIDKTGKSVQKRFRGISAVSNRLRIKNGTPGVAKLDILVNGRSFKLAGLTPGQIKFIDISPAMKKGNKNVLVVRSNGRPGAGAEISFD